MHPSTPIAGNVTAELRVKSEPETAIVNIHHTAPILATIIPKQERSSLFAELEWDPNLEYDPLHPTDYDKIVRGM